MSQVPVMSEEEYEKIVSNKEKLKELGYGIEEKGDFILLTTPSGEKYIFRKPMIEEKEVEQVVLPREGKRYRAVIKNITIAPMYKLFAKKGYNVESMIKKCDQLQDPKEKYYCVKRLRDIGYLIEFEVKDLEMEDFDIIRFTVKGNSRYRELARCYKMFKKGMEIEVMLTDRGRLRIVCPEAEEQ